VRHCRLQKEAEEKAAEIQKIGPFGVSVHARSLKKRPHVGDNLADF
jgi:hypothetical protein